MSLFFLQNNTSYGFASCVCFLSSLLYTCKTLKPYRTNLQFLLVNVWELYPATDRLIKSFIIYLLPLFVITSKRIYQKIQMNKTTNNVTGMSNTKKLFIDNQKMLQTGMQERKNRCNKERKLLRQKD